ncbi:MAG: hypothetical protein ACI8QZ_001205 [Chlamydiales bacterium]|jgi:hypothetical protein
MFSVCRRATRSLSTLLLGLACLSPSIRAQETLTERYAEPAGRILGAALVDTAGWEKLAYMTTHIGHRLSGSRGLERTVEWISSSMKTEGLATRLQEVMVPHWVRGNESAQIVSPAPRELSMLGLGGSVGTAPEGITAAVLVVQSFEELEALDPGLVAGKIVVFAVEWQGYGKTVQYRSSGASRAAAMGAAAVFVRSATGHSLQTPHTGALHYADDQPKIPAAAITPEDAYWMLQCRNDGVEVTAKLTMEAQTLPDASSANIIGEIRGSELPDEVVVMGGHIDSWDVGSGAHDDGAPCIAAWHALTLLHELGFQPRRTLRVVLWTNEENGLRGGKAYREGLGDQVSSHVAAIEMDGGCERPVGFGFSMADLSTEGDSPEYERAHVLLSEIAALFASIDADEMRRGGGGADIGPLMREGVPGMHLNTVGEHYFDWHHTRADTLDKVEPVNFRRAVALFAVMGYVLADMPETLTGE